LIFGLVFVSRDFEIIRNVSSEESAVSLIYIINVAVNGMETV